MRGTGRWLLLIIAMLSIGVLAGCGGSDGQKSEPPPVPAPQVTLQANVTSIDFPGENVVLTWDATDATGVVACSGFTTTELTGSITVSPLETTEYAITVENADGATATAYVQVVVKSDDAPHVFLMADNNQVFPNGSTNLRWYSTYSVKNVVDANFAAPDVSGICQVTPAATTTYFIIVSDANGHEAIAYATVKIRFGLDIDIH